MSIEQMQQQLISQIAEIEDKDILRMLGEELSYSIEAKNDLAGMLSEDDLKELILLSKQPIDKNTMSFNEFNSVMEKWN